jgi:hypothetical protein
MGEQQKREVWTAALEARFRDRLAQREEDLARRARDLAEGLAAGQVTPGEVRALVRLAHQTWSVSDITDWVKVRVGRDGAVAGWAREGIGRELLLDLELLSGDAQHIARELGLRDPEMQRWIHLRLCRELLDRLGAHFEFIVAERPRRKR